MRAPEFEAVYGLLRTYLGKRPRRGPFPLESVLTWCILLCAQRGNDIRGDLLEIGVEFGTSAFLLLESMAAGEHATLIDMAPTEEWRTGIEGPYRDKVNHTFIVANSLHLDRSRLPTGCRWIHIDGGHLYHHVQSDLALTAASLSERGILVLDDFFEIRWPDVTAATLDFLRANDQLTPFLLVNRKLYCTANPAQGAAYSRMFGAFLQQHEGAIGQVRWWQDVTLLDGPILVAKIEPGRPLAALETDRENGPGVSPPLPGR